VLEISEKPETKLFLKDDVWEKFWDEMHFMSHNLQIYLKKKMVTIYFRNFEVKEVLTTQSKHNESISHTKAQQRKENVKLQFVKGVKSYGLIFCMLNSKHRLFLTTICIAEEYFLWSVRADTILHIFMLLRKRNFLDERCFRTVVNIWISFIMKNGERSKTRTKKSHIEVIQTLLSHYFVIHEAIPHQQRNNT
jgi:hypothetical protein